MSIITDKPDAIQVYKDKSFKSSTKPISRELHAQVTKHVWRRIPNQGERIWHVHRVQTASGWQQVKVLYVFIDGRWTRNNGWVRGGTVRGTLEARRALYDVLRNALGRSTLNGYPIKRYQVVKALAGEDLSGGKHTHHIDGCSWNDKPENLDTMEINEHAKIHAIDGVIIEDWARRPSQVLSRITMSTHSAVCPCCKKYNWHYTHPTCPDSSKDKWVSCEHYRHREFIHGRDHTVFADDTTTHFVPTEFKGEQEAQGAAYEYL